MKGSKSSRVCMFERTQHIPGTGSAAYVYATLLWFLNVVAAERIAVQVRPTIKRRSFVRCSCSKLYELAVKSRTLLNGKTTC